MTEQNASERAADLLRKEVYDANLRSPWAHLKWRNRTPEEQVAALMTDPDLLREMADMAEGRGTVAADVEECVGDGTRYEEKDAMINNIILSIWYEDGKYGGELEWRNEKSEECSTGLGESQVLELLVILNDPKAVEAWLNR